MVTSLQTPLLARVRFPAIPKPSEIGANGEASECCIAPHELRAFDGIETAKDKTHSQQVHARSRI